MTPAGDASATGQGVAPEIAQEIAPQTRPRVAAGLRLQWEPVQDCFVLLYPEGMVKLNQSAGEIMKRCDGQRALPAIVEDLEATFSASGLGPDVRAFVEMAIKQGWLTWA